MPKTPAATGSADARPEDLDALRAQMAAQTWPPEQVAKVDGPLLVEIEAAMTAAQAEIDKAAALAARLFQPTVAVGDRVHSLAGGIVSTGKVLKASRAVCLALATRHAETLKG